MIDPKDVVICAATGNARGCKGGPGFVDTWQLLQYTGLKDKNGKEIYEGDLVRAEKTVYEVIFETGGWSYRASASARPWWLFGDAETLEVIGNTYETPELLGAA